MTDCLLVLSLGTTLAFFMHSRVRRSIGYDAPDELTRLLIVLVFVSPATSDVVVVGGVNFCQVFAFSSVL